MDNTFNEEFDESLLEEVDESTPRRTLAYKRYQRHRAISRKKNICRKKQGSDWYKHDGQYDKGKIHCSCGSCKFGRKFGLPTFNDIKNQKKFKADIEDYIAESNAS